MNNYPRNTESDKTSSHKNLVKLLQNGQSWLSRMRYKLLLSQYYNMVFEKKQENCLNLPSNSYFYKVGETNRKIYVKKFIFSIVAGFRPVFFKVSGPILNYILQLFSTILNGFF